ncbi:hypothetical protein Moror_7347 [Moniliophthora roreri MCA 2997]|uniref:Uncharacterized protein n=2 Tax=Moniliophthora roreri TaxID=221103 RepID=V2XQI8_MONRO|nr:hypothetical protein Moror_7347 [Moniliophthora roreri MCA 2997]
MKAITTQYAFLFIIFHSSYERQYFAGFLCRAAGMPFVVFGRISLTFRPQPDQNPPTNYAAFVLSMLKKKMNREDSNTIDQTVLRHCIALSSSYLVSDTCMDPEKGAHTWFTGFSHLVDVVVALHAKGQLELETINAASKACSECWSVAGAWRGLEGCRDGVRKLAPKLKKLLDENGRTYRGERVYAP